MTAGWLDIDPLPRRWGAFSLWVNVVAAIVPAAILRRDAVLC